MAKRNDSCPCGARNSEGLSVKYKKCCLKWHNMGWPSPPRNGLPSDPKPCGRSLGMTEGPPGVWKDRWMIEKSGNYRQIWDKVYDDEYGVERVKTVKSWYSVYRKGELGE